MKHVLATAMAVALVLAADVSAIAAPAEPDATLEFSGGSSATGVGYTWAGGTLHYHGKAYPFRLSGLSVVHIDTSIEASGEVYHLAKLADFAGDYMQVDAETALPGSGTGLAIRTLADRRLGRARAGLALRALHVELLASRSGKRCCRFAWWTS